MRQMTLSEIKTEYGISRRAIQGYEKEGIIESSGKTIRGYLLYDETTVGRILEIKTYQNMGFKVKEITGLLKLTNIEKRKLIANKKKEVIKKHKEQIDLLDYVYESLKTC